MASDQQDINSQNKGDSGSHETGVRKLCAIMFTDIKDFSGKMQRNEVGTMRLLGIHNRMMTDAVHKFDGTVIKTVGDAFLVTFDSVVSATQCAISIQQQFIEYNAQIKSEDEKITVRIGVHLGDVFVKDKDVFGDGVNIASRIQSMAEVGGVNISDSVYQQVRAKLNIKVLNLGVPQLKGIATPVKVFQVIIVPTDKARGKFATNLFVFKTILKRKKTKKIIGISFASLVIIAAAVWYFLGPAPPPNSLAVLPFKYIGDSEESYIADGFTDDINISLSRFSSIKVLSSKSTDKYKDTKLTEEEIATELNVRYILTGVIETKGNNLTVRFTMNEPLTKESILSDNFRETREDLFAIRREITQKVANHFDVEVRGDVNVSPEAYSLYIRALEYDRLETKEDNQLAIATLSQAIEKDANFLDAYVKLASNQLLNHERGYDLDEKWLNEVEQNINKVLAKDESRADCFWLLGRLYIQRGDHKKGVENLEKAIELNSNQMRPYVTLGEEYATNLGDPAKALTYFQQAYDLEPTNFNISVNIGIANAMIKNYDEAEKAFRKATNQNRTHELPWINLGYLYELLGKGDSAEIAFMNAAERNPKNPETAKHLAFMLINRGRVAQAESALTSTLKFESSNDELSYILGIAQEKRGKIKEAKETWKGGQLLVEAKIKDNPNVPELYFYLGLISARLGEKEKAVTNAMTAVRMDSTDDNVMGVSRVYAILKNKKEMLNWFSRARAMNTEYDETFVATDIDFLDYRNDKDLIVAAKK